MNLFKYIGLVAAISSGVMAAPGQADQQAASSNATILSRSEQFNLNKVVRGTASGENPIHACGRAIVNAYMDCEMAGGSPVPGPGVPDVWEEVDPDGLVYYSCSIDVGCIMPPPTPPR